MSLFSVVKHCKCGKPWILVAPWDKAPANGPEIKGCPHCGGGPLSVSDGSFTGPYPMVDPMTHLMTEDTLSPYPNASRSIRECAGMVSA